MERKVRGDPLFAIKKRQQEQMRAELSNPVRLAQLKALAEAGGGKKHKKSKKDCIIPISFRR